MKIAVIVFSTHLKLESLKKSKEEISSCEKVVLFTPQYVFENEQELIRSIIPNSSFLCFADVMSDKDGEECDLNAFKKYEKMQDLRLSSMNLYFHDITKLKNNILENRIEEKFQPVVKHIYSNDLGIDSEVWLERGYKWIEGDYFYKNENISILQKIIIKTKQNPFFYFAKQLGINYPRNVYVAHYKDKTLLFHGHLQRAGYRFNIQFEKDNWEAFKHWIVKLLYTILKVKVKRSNVINISTLHEYGNYAYYEMIDIPDFNNYLVQDGLLPCNDTCKYLFFYGKNTHFLSWDKLGSMVFDYHNIPVKIMPFRNIFPLPFPIFRPLKRVLCVSSGAGDWTAIKNRSDEDKTAVAFVEIARRYPEIEFTYRCHPSWVAPGIQGVNSIQRLASYFDSTGLSNIKVSSNIPSFFDKKGNPVVSQKRSSLDSDLAEADFVFGVHSVSMLDGALKKIPFASVNMSGRRNLFKGISDLGFPHCESIDDIVNIIESVQNDCFQKKYNKAIESYNSIISEE